MKNIVPNIIFKTRVKDKYMKGSNPYKWQDVSSDDYFKGKKVILFSLPGAFTPVCSTFQLPGFEKLYDKYTIEIMELLSNKNHDYDEAWKEMRISSMTDIILMKLYRTKQIESNNGKTLISEGIKANYQDIVNYSIFIIYTISYSLSRISVSLSSVTP